MVFVLSRLVFFRSNIRDVLLYGVRVFPVVHIAAEFVKWTFTILFETISFAWHQ